MTPKIWAVVPVKSFAGAKKRLASVLDPVSREALVRAMAKDVIQTLKGVRQLTGILVVTASAEVQAFARIEGIGDWHDPLSGDLTGTLEAAAEYIVASRRADTMMIVPCDVPLVRDELLSEALDRHESLTLASDDRGEGTNLLIATPPNLIRLCYDGHGFRTHLSRGRSLGLTPQIIEDDSIHLDVDTGDDFKRLRSFEAHPRFGQAESVRISCTIQSAD